MVHFPSFLVGSIVAGTGFLVVHRDLSHRNRLSARWALAEWADGEFRGMMKALNSSSEGKKDSNKTSMVLSNPTVTTWNKAVGSIRGLVQDAFFGKKEN
mmetsp:Transcript_36764/g.54010  ORF Transcript_36764/g.54010 Transcript_36764/m.54010 type:complete len:99 (-) Transcript_36764:596-892(-)|eukprot:CAMPEP_0195521352 /NCGR_PEP_ID=MMETSP0794_2-20130614/18530_1 /TAXON_ID=515487 /ORGANISM="Stephanopyxis turris, Strain CCMP 815" /LENGTH=98 /DNA_ID=CAMNT_0040650887 /DNA_START=93 /DNA_END=389 /DNA_ORIENTATION=+